MFTRASVHCAERIVAASSSNGDRWSSSHSADGYSASSAATMCAARAVGAGCRRRAGAAPFAVRRVAAMVAGYCGATGSPSVDPASTGTACRTSPLASSQ